jgi:hypothetical protein
MTNYEAWPQVLVESKNKCSAVRSDKCNSSIIHIKTKILQDENV